MKKINIQSNEGHIAKIKEFLDFKIKNHNNWSPEYPNLYDINVKLFKVSQESNDSLIEFLDNVSERFGFREFTVKNNKFNISMYLEFFEIEHHDLLASSIDGVLLKIDL